MEECKWSLTRICFHGTSGMKARIHCTYRISSRVQPMRSLRAAAVRGLPLPAVGGWWTESWVLGLVVLGLAWLASVLWAVGCSEGPRRFV